MGKTIRRQSSWYDEDQPRGRKAKGSGHSNNRRSGGMRVINDSVDDDQTYDDDAFDDSVGVHDEITFDLKRKR